VIVLAGDLVLHGRIENIGTDGFLATTATRSPESLLGQEVVIELRLDGQMSEWLRLSGRVLQLGASAIAVAFETVTAEFVRLIDETSVASHSHRRILQVVLVDATTERRLVIAEAFRAAGCAVVDVLTPLEAIVRLGESLFEPDLIAIADSSPASTSDELRRFIDREHPRAKLVTIGDDLVEPNGLAHWLSSTNPDGDLASRVRRVLTHPARS